jgi:hypothetical protein
MALHQLCHPNTKRITGTDERKQTEAWAIHHSSRTRPPSGTFTHHKYKHPQNWCGQKYRSAWHKNTLHLKVPNPISWRITILATVSGTQEIYEENIFTTSSWEMKSWNSSSIQHNPRPKAPTLNAVTKTDFKLNKQTGIFHFVLKLIINMLHVFNYN